MSYRVRLAGNVRELKNLVEATFIDPPRVEPFRFPTCPIRFATCFPVSANLQVLSASNCCRCYPKATHAANR